MTTYVISFKKKFRMSQYLISTMYLYEDPLQDIYRKMANQKLFPTTQGYAALSGNIFRTFTEWYSG